ncbi:MAG: transposase [Sulfuricella sp.]
MRTGSACTHGRRICQEWRGRNFYGSGAVVRQKTCCHTERRTRKDWASQIKEMLDERYLDAIKVRLVMDNLNTHSIISLYETFEPKEARRLAERLDIHYTPKHGSWLNMAEIELSVLKGQCLSRRIDSMENMKTEVATWEQDRNNSLKKINWQFTTSEARIKLTRLYPKL